MEYASSWNPVAQLDWPRSWNMLVHKVPWLNSVDPSLGIELVESYAHLYWPLSWNMQVYGIRMGQPWNNRGMAIWNNYGNGPSPTKCLKRARMPNECLTKIARSRSTCGMVRNMYGIRVEYKYIYIYIYIYMELCIIYGVPTLNFIDPSCGIC